MASVSDMKKIRMYVFNRDGWHCAVCHKKIDWSSGQLAHRMAKTKANLKKYGERVINHPFNLRATCSLKCNSAVLIDGKPQDKEQLVFAIKKEIENKGYGFELD